MSRFYVSPNSVKDGKIYVEREGCHHIIDVMRLGKGDGVVVFDGTGKEYVGKIGSVNNKRVIIDILKTRIVDRRQSVRISLAQAIPKKDKMDLIVQKATELGIDEIVPFESSRTVVKSKGERSGHKIERWFKIAIEASKQCGRSRVPKVQNIAHFNSVLDDIPKYGLAIMPCLADNKTTLLKSALKKVSKPDNVLVIIGPEGGFSEDEIDKANARGAVLVSLGDLVLRSDTAAIAAISILNHEFA